MSATDVRWRGLLVGTAEHGYSLISEDCQRRGIRLSDWQSAPLDETLRRQIREPGLVRVEVSGKIIEDELLVSDVYGITFTPMNDDNLRRHFRSLGF